MRGYARRRDTNEPAIILALESVGAAVCRLDGKGIPDLLVSFRNRLTLLEVKNPEAKGGGKYNTGEGPLTRAQVDWRAKWAARGGLPPVDVYTPMDALEAVGAR